MNTLLDLLLKAWDWLVLLPGLLRDLVVAEAREHPGRVVFALYVFARLLGTTIQTGNQGVRFRFGRVRSSLEPGFHWKVPGLERIRIVPARSQTLDLQGQRISTPRGLVLKLDANLVYRIDDPVLAMVQIDDYQAGCLNALALSVQEVVWRFGDHAMRDLTLLSRELVAALTPRLQRWGIAVEEAGFTTLAPSARTLRFTQLGLRLQERRLLLGHFTEAGLPERQALGLLGSSTQLRERASVRYRSMPTRHVRRLVRGMVPIGFGLEEEQVQAQVQLTPSGQRRAASVKVSVGEG